MTEEEEKRRTTRHRRRANPATATTSSRSGSTSSLVTTKSVVTAAVVAYGGYQFAQWYWKGTRTPRPQTTTNTGEGNERDEKEDEETERPLEDDLFDLLFHHLPAEEKEKERDEEEQQYQSNATMNPASSSSWLSLLTPSLSTTTTVLSGIATMLWGDRGSRSSIGVGGDQGQGQDQAQSYPRPPPQSRRQGIAQCRYQTRVAFQNCLPTIQGVIEQLTETASYTKELKQLRKQKQVRRRRKVQQQQQQQQQEGEEEKKENTHDAAATATANANDFDFDEDETDDEELLWCDILIETLTRMMVSSYAYTLLLLSLTVQIHSWHAVGAVATAIAEADEASSTATPAAATSTCSVTERWLMRSHQYFLTEGLPLLVNTIRKAIAEEIVVGSCEGSCTEETAVDDATTTTTPTCWETPSQHFVTVHDIEQRLYTQLPHVLDDVSGNTRANRQNRHRRTRNRRHRRRMYRRRNWIRFVLPDENTTETDEDTNTPTHEEASSSSSSSHSKSPVEPVAVFDPIWDICQSPVWEDAQEQILHSLWYNTLRDGKQHTTTHTNKGWGNLFVDVQQQQQPTQEIKQPLATVMARFKKSTSLLFDNDNDDDVIITRMIEKLQKLPTVVELGDISFH